MKRHAEQEEDHAENGDRWLLTYSDMITLLLALFIILYSMSSVESQKFAEIAMKFTEAFHNVPNVQVTDSTEIDTDMDVDAVLAAVSALGNGESTAVKSGETGSGTGTGNGTGTGSGTGTGNGTGTGSGSGTYAGPLDEIYAELSKYIQENNLSSQIVLTNAKTYVRISIQGVLMFYPDSASLLPNSQPILKEVSEALRHIYDKVDHITISGHTATKGEYTDLNNSVAWRLSIDRANTVRSQLSYYGVPEGKLSLEGYGHNVPVADNSTEEGRSKNRRAEITVYKFESD